MAFEFKDVKDEETEDFYPANITTSVRNVVVLPCCLPDGVFDNECQNKDVLTTDYSVSALKNIKLQVIAQTCTADFHRRKGYLDSDENSIITFYELLRLFDVNLPDKLIKIPDIIIEHDDCFIYVCSDAPKNNKVAIDPTEFEFPSNDRLIIYVMNDTVNEKLNQETEYRKHCETIFERLTDKESKKPILVFNWIDKVNRGGLVFSATEILRILGEDGFENILSFQGIHKYSRKNKDGEILMERSRGINGTRYDVVRLKTIQDFIEYWDKQIEEWTQNGKITSDEKYWEIPVGKRKGKPLSDCIGLDPKLIPEPYFGNPENCLLVIVNFNPGTGGVDENNNKANTQHIDNRDNPETACGSIVKDCYSSIAKSFPMLDDEDIFHPHKRSDKTIKNYNEKNTGQPFLGLPYPGYNWWHRKKEWFDEIKTDFSFEHEKPFALELCGWHSKGWKNVVYSDDLLKKISDRLQNVIIEAIHSSDLKIGICVGSPFKKILEYMGYTQIPLNKAIELENWVEKTYNIRTCSDYFLSVTEEKETVRGYRLFQHKKTDTFVINTWQIGSNQYPSDSFKEFELRLFESIRKEFISK